MSKAFEFKIEYEADKETGQITATIPELNHISSFGNSFAEAEANLREAALGYLEVLVRSTKKFQNLLFILKVRISNFLSQR